MNHTFLDIPADSDFSLQNLPYGIFSTAAHPPRVGVAIGDFVLDLALLAEKKLLPTGSSNLFDRPSLNAFMAAGPAIWQAVRDTLTELLSADTPTLRDDALLRQQCLRPQTAVTLHLPAAIGDYTDFYASKEHATNVGRLFRPDNPLLPNWVHLPIAYHGRASSVVVSGTPVRRPSGQILPPGQQTPLYSPTQQLDFELEVGLLTGPGNRLGNPIPIEQAEQHIFGLVLVNDWSARDIQRWEYQPLGPFLGKNFATSISPWVVPLAALEPFRTAGPAQDPRPLPYLQSAHPGAFDILLEAMIQPAGTAAETTLSRTNFKYLYWSMAQQIAHHTVNGCNLRPGDLLASGTISGPTADSHGSLLEITQGGQQPFALPGGSSRTFLADGDTLTLRGWCQGDGYRVGFGAVSGQIIASSPPHDGVMARS